ncbi:MAG: 2-(1,2-epoxy-1,2-dihydrophenyl)acetyl-CoA isomerase [Parasphingorhabdus sp.]|jgi:2-(1,2-epoxy-1,2-dihydrophenyl)acetyl-CoA isomerase
MSYSQIEVSSQDNITTIRLNRPAQLNSFTEVLCSEVQDALTHADSDSSIRCICLTGAGKAFSAGQDLAEIGLESDNPKDLCEILENNINPIILKIRECATPVVAAVNGVAAGAGANLALACDMVVATRAAKFLQAFRHVGLLPDAGGTWLLPRLAGQARATGMAMLGEPVSAQQAEQWGLIWQCVDDDQFTQTVLDLCRKLATGPGLALGLAKKAMMDSQNNSLSEQLQLERDFQQAASSSDDYREGVQAFLQKRKPEFKGS